MRAPGDRAVLGAVVLASLLASAALLAGRLRRASHAPAEERSQEQEEPPPEPSAPRVADAGPPEAPPLPAYVHLDPDGARACAPGMVLVDGVHCPFVAHRCGQFLSEPDGACKTFVPEVICEGRLQRRRFCIDVFEYPNLEGVRPAARVAFPEAEAACAVEGKRLCTVDEWEFACEGTQMWPYPYGLERDAEACNIDRPEPSATPPDVARDPRRISDEVARLDQRASSGEKERCISPFGVRDLTGNVAEWTVNPNGTKREKPFRSALEGSGWGSAPARCRAMTTQPDTWTAHDVGFRCCRDAPKPSRTPNDPAAPESTGPRKSRLVPP